jgi:hypothetical protein
MNGVSDRIRIFRNQVDNILTVPVRSIGKFKVSITLIFGCPAGITIAHFGGR